ncbi:hypothetical protein P7K49_023541 [Saguinus oedipus]|uniref:Uncharacterized protein n=1 Tax=Saguinus oedipus TaxID=9490 RepID=A0ABQ9ULY8_SAGOE|nr:hypothetical protein P7K49_023541 [Saguinus oedipus]
MGNCMTYSGTMLATLLPGDRLQNQVRWEPNPGLWILLAQLEETAGLSLCFALAENILLVSEALETMPVTCSPHSESHKCHSLSPCTCGDVTQGPVSEKAALLYRCSIRLTSLELGKDTLLDSQDEGSGLPAEPPAAARQIDVRKVETVCS